MKLNGHLKALFRYSSVLEVAEITLLSAAGPGTSPGIPAPPFFDGAPRTTRPRESPSWESVPFYAIYKFQMIVQLQGERSESIIQNIVGMIEGGLSKCLIFFDK